jgi:hypothetical protein
MPRDLDSLARWLESQPCNRDGTDKTYVLLRFEAMTRFARLVRNAVRVDTSD